MTKRHRPATRRPVVPGPATPATPSYRSLDLVAAAAGLLIVTLTWLSRAALNPDGVSYLDLAGMLGHGDWSHVVQGYWSPLFPLLIGVVGALTGLSHPGLVALTHVVNGVLALATLALLWYWARARQQPAFGRAAIAAFALVSAGMPRVEAVTPDVMLLGVMAWLSYQLLRHGARRWMLVGVLLGLTFLVKTSSWPWLIIALPLLWWCGEDQAARRRALRSGAVCVAVTLLWVVPMSVKYGHATLGSSGSLNYSWYIDANSSRLPDGDHGTNLRYQALPLAGQPPLELATFDQSAAWTYQPWGDPTAWHGNVLSETGRPPTVTEIVSYWLRVAGRVFGLWLLPTLIAVLLPAYLLHRRTGAVGELWRDRRRELVVIVLGLAGLLQFVAVHAEPRLLAPFGMMLALGVLSWCFSAGTDRPPLPYVLRCVLAWLGVGVAAGFAVPKVIDGVHSGTRLTHATALLDKVRADAARTGMPIHQIAIEGYAAPVLSAAYWLGSHIAAQIPPESARRLEALPPAQQRALLIGAFGGRVALLWQTDANGGLQMLVIPARVDSS